MTFPNGAPPTTAANLTELFGAQLPAGTPPYAIIPVHPSQLYEVAMGLGMFAVLWRLRGHRHAEGWLFGVYCVLAGVERFLVEFVRAKDDRLFGWLTTAQAISLGAIVVGLAVMQWRRTPGPGRSGIYADAATPAVPVGEPVPAA